MAAQESTVSLLCGPLLAGSQLPPISKFSGEEQDGEGKGFEEWIEQFELVAELCKWDSQARLVNLATRLCGTAYSFYCTCSPEQGGSYDALKAQLLTSQDTDCTQQPLKHVEKESVDQYAQELCKLFYKAYPRTR